MFWTDWLYLQNLAKVGFFFHEIRRKSVLPNAKCSQILKMVKKFTKFCQILQICPISQKFLNRLFFGRLAWNFACAYSWRIRTLLYCQNFIRLCQFFSILQNFREICSDWQTFAISQKVMDGSLGELPVAKCWKYRYWILRSILHHPKILLRFVHYFLSYGKSLSIAANLS